MHQPGSSESLCQGRLHCVVPSVLTGVSLSPRNLVIAYLCPFLEEVGEESKQEHPDSEGNNR